MVHFFITWQREAILLLQQQILKLRSHGWPLTPPFSSCWKDVWSENYIGKRPHSTWAKSTLQCIIFLFALLNKAGFYKWSWTDTERSSDGSHPAAFAWQKKHLLIMIRFWIHDRRGNEHSQFFFSFWSK